MPPLPRYTAKITPKPVGKAPIPLAAADIGAGAIGRGLQRLGRGISDIAKSIFQIEQDKQIIRDNAALASANGDYDKAVADKINEAKRTDFTSIEQFADFREQAESDLDSIVKSSVGKMSLKAGQTFSNFAKSNKQNSLRQIEGIVWQKEIQFGQSDTLRQYSNKFEVLAGAGVSVEDILKDPSLDIIETGMNPYWRAGELTKARDRTLIDALVNVGRYDDARELTQTTEAFTSTEKKTRLNEIRISKSIAETRAKEAREQLIKDITSQTINEYFRGELEVDELFRRHSLGLIKDSEFKFIIDGLRNPMPDNSDPFASGRIRRAMVDFNLDIIDRTEADKIILENYNQLDDTDRSKVVSDIEILEEKIIATAKSKAYSEGVGLISRRFVGIQTEEDLLDIFRGAGLSDEEKKRINRRWTAEVNNRNLYEKAVDGRFKEMRQEKITGVGKYESESLRILLQYQRRGRLTLEELEVEVSKEQQKIIGEPTIIKPVNEMTISEKRRELERIRELKRLTR